MSQSAVGTLLLKIYKRASWKSVVFLLPTVHWSGVLGRKPTYWIGGGLQNLGGVKQSVWTLGREVAGFMQWWNQMARGMVLFSVILRF